jgi:hypothetical protein
MTGMVSVRVSNSYAAVRPAGPAPMMMAFFCMENKVVGAQITADTILKKDKKVSEKSHYAGLKV